VIKAAIANVLHRLAALPPSENSEALRTLGREYLREAGTWTSSHPAAQDKERLMRRALKLHTEVARLERGTPE
jgi:hypothetical protein